MDILDLTSPVILYEAEGRPGLAKLYRYQVMREGAFQQNPREIPDHILEFFDLLAAAFLKASADGAQLRDAVADPALGLVRPKGGRPENLAVLRAKLYEKNDAKPYRAALARAELIESGIPPEKADEEVREAFGYKDTRAVRKATADYAEAVAIEMDHRASDRRFEALIDRYGRMDEMFIELRALCRRVTKDTPRARLVLAHRHTDGTEVPVTFPPLWPSRVKRLASENEEDRGDPFEFAHILLAAEYGYRLKDVRKAFRGWDLDDREAFASAALEHLRSAVGGTETIMVSEPRHGAGE